MSQIAASLICSSCEASNFEDAKFCSTCGSNLLQVETKQRAIIVREFASGALESAGLTARDLLSNDTVQKIAGGALLGLGVAAVVPFVSFTVGATLGAAYVGYKKLTKD